MRFRRNLYIGTNFSRGKGISMSLKQKKLFRKGDLVIAVYRKVPFTKRSKSEFTKIKSGKFLWSNSQGKVIGVTEIKDTTLSTQYSQFKTSSFPLGKYTVEYISNEDTSVHEKSTFYVYDATPFNALKNKYREQILSSLTSPKTIDELKTICGVS